ncbi:histidine kinase [Fervidicella metallireducens AeB]|uniref:histidine kinase n=1 Tax=Fervidicella metallireducens AeB TaxID=1403537 RepID=A0A017RVM9_9CLOT|nr:ATP-binding protein [Fervidicella metallireducens]EYE88454.1 histidine kinase [Fervidicella metallireducens AeB]
MRELSLHIMDIAENSVTAGADLIEITIEENRNEDYLLILVKDNGSGIDEEMLKDITDPFVTTRKTRRVGLGLSLFEAACVRCDGYLKVESKKHYGTKITAFMKYNHIDRAPLGKVEETILSLLLYDRIDLIYRHIINEKEFIFETKEIKKIVGEDINSPEILQWIKEYISQNINALET